MPEIYLYKQLIVSATQIKDWLAFSEVKVNSRAREVVYKIINLVVPSYFLLLWLITD